MPQYTELTREKSHRFSWSVGWYEDKLFPPWGWWFHSQNWSDASVLIPTVGWNSSTPTETIKAADSLQRKTNQFFPFSKAAEIGSNEILKSPEAEGIELRIRANCPVRGHSSLLPSLPKPIARSGVLRFNNSLEGLPESCYPHCFSLFQGKDTDRISQRKRHVGRVQKSTNCIPFLASVCDNRHRAVSAREVHPILSVPSF